MVDHRQTMYPALRYRDARSALDWMKRTLEGEEVLVVDGADDDQIAHAEVRIAGAIVMFGSEASAREPHARPSGVGAIYVAIDDPDRLHGHVVATGGEVVMGLTDTDYGSRDFTVRDPEGNLWSFGTYRP